MKKIVYLLLAISLGLNAGFLGAKLAGRSGEAVPSGPGGQPGPPPGARPGERPPGTHPGDRPPAVDPAALLSSHVQGMTRHLGLTAEQQRAVHDSLLPHMSRLTELRGQIRALEAELSRAFAAVPLDEDRFMTLAREISAAKAEMDSISVMMLLAEAAVLTDEQRVKFAEVAPRIHMNPDGAAPRGQGPPPGDGRPPGQGPPPGS